VEDAAAVKGLLSPLKSTAAATALGFSVCLLSPDTVQASTLTYPFAATGVAPTAVARAAKRNWQSSGWELARQKRTQAVKALQRKNIVEVSTDDAGNQFLSLPWIKGRKIPYKSLTTKQRLRSEVYAGAFGEVCKDFLLHPVDTAKTRRQVRKKSQTLDSDNNDDDDDVAAMEKEGPELRRPNDSPFDSTSSVAQTLPELGIFSQAKSLYAAFPIVMLSSIPQGGAFFLVKKGLLEARALYAPDLPASLASILAIVFGVMAYWVFRTPAEVVKTQVQTGQCDNIVTALQPFTGKNIGNAGRLWKNYGIMLSLDAPFQVMNFLLYSLLSDAVVQYGFEMNTLTRLACGVACGMICAAATCPIDVAKTRIISRDRNKEDDKEQEKQPRRGTGKLSNIPSHAVDYVMSVETNAVPRCTNDALSRTTQREPSRSPSPRASYSAGVDRQRAIIGTSAGTAVLERPTVQAAKETEIGIRKETQEKDLENTEIDIDINSALKRSSVSSSTASPSSVTPTNVVSEIISIVQDEGPGTLFLGVGQRLIYTGLANGIRLAAYGTSRMDLMMRSLDDL
jgi:hypothetical protein